jgi:hypothetical protein
MLFFIFGALTTVRGYHGIAKKLEAFIQGVDVIKAQRALSPDRAGRHLYPARTHVKDMKNGFCLDQEMQYSHDENKYCGAEEQLLGGR